MNTKSVEKIRQMQAMTRNLSDEQLVFSYLVVVQSADPDPAAQLLKGVLQDELEQRNPAIADATEAWVNDLESSDTQDDVVLRVLGVS